MNVLDLFKKRDSTPPPVDTRTEVRNKMLAAQAASANWINPAGVFTGDKFGSINYSQINSYNYTHLRRNSNGVYNSSLIAAGIINRLEDNVINTGLTWESSPLWNLITDAPKSEDEKYSWTQKVESMWKLYSGSKEADIEGLLTFNQLQRKVFKLNAVDGEMFGILRYLNSPSRMSPVAIQLIKPDQVINPTSSEELKAIKVRGGSVDHGIEKDSTGRVVAIHVRGDDLKTKRIPIHGPKSGRRFVIHTGNFEAVGQWRGLPELSKLIYEIHTLTKYDIAELEATVASAIWMGVVEADKDAAPGKHPKLAPNLPNKDTSATAPKTGVEEIEIGQRALIMNNLAPGYTFKGFQPTRPNQNYEKFVETFETRIAGSLGMPLSVFMQRFQGSYSAARAEILFFWNNVVKRRHDFVSGFIAPYHEAWFSELVKATEISAPGFDRPITRRAWLYGVWTGISRPVVDPLKEVKASENRTKLGHTTGEREAKAYNGSDYRENVERLKTENQLLADANKVLDPAKYKPVTQDGSR